MIGTVEVRCCAAQPQKPLSPCFVFKDSPQSFRIMDVPKSLGEWEITRVYVGLNYPDNTNVEKDATRQGNVWVATVEGCPVAGKTMGGFTIYADGTDENGNAVEGYVLGNGDIYVLDKSEKISALVGKSTMRILDDIPAAPSKGDVVIVNGALKIYDGEEWYNVEVDLSDYYTKEEIDEKVDEIDSSLGELSSSIGALDSSVSDLQGSMSQIESSVSELSSSLTDLDSSLTELDDLAVKYSDSEKVMVQMNSPNSVFMLKMNDTDAAAGNTRILWNDGTNYIARNALRIGVPDEGETVQHMGTTNVQMGGVHNDAIVGIGGGITIFSSAEKGKTKMFMDDDRIFVTTPATVEEGQTLKAIKVANENALSGRSVKMAKRDGEQAQEEVEEQDWHWEYVSADLPSRTSDLTNDSGFVTEDAVSTKRDYFDLTYPKFNDDINTGFNMRFAYSYVGGIGSMLPFENTEYIDGDLCATWGWHGQILIASPDGKEFKVYDKFDELKYTIYLTEFAETSEWLDFKRSGLEGMVIDALEVPRDVTIYLQDASGTSEPANFVLDTQLSAYATTSALESVSASVSTMASSVADLVSGMSVVNASVSALGSSVSALTSSLSAKRDYTDLTYSYSTPAEQFNLASLQSSNPSYCQKVSFTLNGGVHDADSIPWDSNHWWNDFAQIEVFWGEDESLEQRLCLWMDDGTSEGYRFPFDPADGQNSQTWTFTSDNTYTLTMTFTGEQGQTVNDNLALQGSVNALASSVEANASAIQANASAIEANASAISAVAGSLNVSGIGCSTVVMSGTYADSTSFAYNVVIQPSE